MALPVVYEHRPWTSTETGAMACRPASHLNPASSSFTPSSASHAFTPSLDKTSDTLPSQDGPGCPPHDKMTATSISELASMFGRLRFSDCNPRKTERTTTQKNAPTDQMSRVGAGPGVGVGTDVHATPHAGHGRADDPCLGVEIRHNDPPMKSEEFGALVNNQVSRHLEGQFDFLLKMPEADADADLDTAADGPQEPPISLDDHIRAKLGTMSPLSTGKLRYFGCNVVARRRRSSLGPGPRCPRLGANIVTVVATPLADPLGNPKAECAERASTLAAADAAVDDKICHHQRESADIGCEEPAMAVGAVPPAPVVETLESEPLKVKTQVDEAPERERLKVKTRLDETPERQRLKVKTRLDETREHERLKVQTRFDETHERECLRVQTQFDSSGAQSDGLTQTPPRSTCSRESVYGSFLSPEDRSDCGVRNSPHLSLLSHRSDSRIEDSLEALDMLEEEFDAIDALTRVEPVHLPERYPQAVETKRLSRSLANTPITKRTLPEKSASVRGRPQSLIPASTRAQTISSPSAKLSNRRSIADFTFFKKDAEVAVSPSKKTMRPSSLLPPKPLAKSSKVPTIPSFELPGKAVARRLKEQKEARLAQQQQQQQSSPEWSSTRFSVRSTKTPTRANFELPGEALARRKREERASRLQQEAEEEEEQRRKDLKSRLARAIDMVKPRDTTISRTRLAKTEVEENMTRRVQVTSTTTTTTKRSSLMIATGAKLLRQPLTVSAMARVVATQSGRGRESLVPQIKREAVRESSTSTSGASSGSARSTVSVEEMYAQSMRGKEIISRDRRHIDELEQTQLAKEQMIKSARDEAADRSRRLSRQWADGKKQSFLRALARMD